MRIVQDEAAVRPLVGPVVLDRLVADPSKSAGRRPPEERRHLRRRRRRLVGRPGRPGAGAQVIRPRHGHRRLVRRAPLQGSASAVAGLDVHQDERIEHHRQPARLQLMAIACSTDASAGVPPKTGRPSTRLDHPRRAARHARRPTQGIGVAVLAPPARRRAASVQRSQRRSSPNQATTSDTDLAFGSSADSWSSETDEVRRPAGRCARSAPTSVALAAPEVDRLGRQRVLAGPRHQRHAAHVERRRPRHARQPPRPAGTPRS